MFRVVVVVKEEEEEEEDVVDVVDGLLLLLLLLLALLNGHRSCCCLREANFAIVEEVFRSIMILLYCLINRQQNILLYSVSKYQMMKERRGQILF